MRDAVLWLGVASCVGALFVSAPLAVALASLVIAWMLRRRWLVVLCVLLLLVGFVRARRVMRVYEEARDAIVLSGGWPAKCTLAGDVVASPVLLGSGLRVVVDAEDIRCPTGPPGRGRVTLYVQDAPIVARGDRVEATASIAPPYRFWNDGVGDPRPSSARRGSVLSGGADDLVVIGGPRAPWIVGHLIDRLRARLRARILATFPADTAPMARALVLGEDDLDERDSLAFRKSGLAHLLAVSGMHLVLVVMGSVAALRVLLVRVPPLGDRFDVGRLAAACGIPFAWLYADLAGSSGSAVRAAWMCSVVLLARAMAGRPEPWRALGLSLLAMSLVDPLVAYDVSFVLSALATAGLLGISPAIESWVAERRWALPKLVVKPLATTIAATMACAPVLATIAPELALGGLVANLVAVPLGEAAALPLCLLHGLLEPWPDAERGCAITASGALVLVRLVARGFAWATIPLPAPTPAQLAVLATAGAAVAWLERRRRVVVLACTVALVLLEGATRIRGAPRGVLRATFIDVGQGDAALLDLPDGSAMLIDAGGLVGSPIDVGSRAVGAVLAARRRTHLRAVVLSHPHPDHFLGMSSALSRVKTDAFWDTGEETAIAAEMRSRGVPTLRPRELCGAHRIGGATIEVLAPCPGPTPDRGANDNSFVIRVRYGKRAMLFVGDAEHTEEAELLASNQELRADVLKVGHHGSRTSSTPAFLARVQPEVAVISCGVRNRFGHPHPTTLEHLEGRPAIRVFRTDRDGAVVVETDGQDLSTTPMNGRLR